MKVVTFYTIVDGRPVVLNPARLEHAGEFSTFEWNTDAGGPLVFCMKLNKNAVYAEVVREWKIGAYGLIDIENKNGLYTWRFLPLNVFRDIENGKKPAAPKAKAVKKPAAPKAKAVKKPAAPKRKPYKPSNLRKTLRDSAVHESGICSYATELVYKDTGATYVSNHRNDCCHARMGIPYDKAGKVVIKQIALNWDKHIKDVKEATPYIDWFVRRSPFKQFIKPATAYTAIKYGLLVDVDKATISQATWVGVSMRWTQEHFRRLAYFNHFKSLPGSSENAAFVLTNTIDTSSPFNAQAKLRLYTVIKNVAAHDAFDSSVTVNQLTKVFKEGTTEPHEKVPCSQQETVGYRAISKVYFVKGCEKSPSLFTWLNEHKNIKKQEGGWGGEVTCFDEEGVIEVLKDLVNIVG